MYSRRMKMSIIKNCNNSAFNYPQYIIQEVQYLKFDGNIISGTYVQYNIAATVFVNNERFFSFHKLCKK